MAEEQRATSQGRAVIMKHPKTGKEVRRVDYIREQYNDGKDPSRPRGEIARELGVPYQIVFAATKKQPEKPKEAEKPKDATGGKAATGGKGAA